MWLALPFRLSTLFDSCQTSDYSEFLKVSRNDENYSVPISHRGGGHPVDPCWD
jgi:hypothetical protein